MLEYNMHFRNAAKWLAFTNSSCASVNVVTITIFPGSVGSERLKIRILSKILAVIRTHRHNEGPHIGASSSYGRNKSVELLPVAMLVCLNIAPKTLGESVSLFLGDR